jgi:hypothetical protein
VVSCCSFNCHFRSDEWCSFFHIFFTILIYYFVKYLLKSFTHFKKLDCFNTVLYCKGLLHILDTSSLSKICFTNIFSQFVDCILIFLCLQSNKNFYLFLFFVVLGLELRAYTLSHSTSPFCDGFFQYWVTRVICPDWLQTAIILISAS